MKPLKYRIYPSLLDKFQALLDSEVEADSFYNTDSETGEQKLTADEIADRHERELLDTINRVPREPSEAADKGTCFNEVVDCIIEHRKSSRDDVKITTIKEGEYVYEIRGDSGKEIDKQLLSDELTKIGKHCILALMDGFHFYFDIPLCKEVAAMFKGAVCQHLCRATIETAYGTVELYGYADEIVRDKVHDLKTTSSYTFGKFERAWQKDVYPYCLVASGEMDEVKEFEYTVVKFKGGTSRTPLITGDIYQEAYTYNHEAATVRLRQMLERFIEWLEANRHKITDKKIFNEQ